MIDRSDGSPEIRLTELTKHFREVRAVDRVSIDIQPGEFFSMLGPSGCGKTTTLRMIGGFELPTSGRIELRGRDVTTDPPDKRPVNMVFQNYALFPHLDVADNIAFGLRRKGVDKAQTKRRVGEALELVHLAGYDRRKPNQLSGGQQQRVALARALVNRPNVLLLDEPLGALDLKLRKALQIELKRVQIEVGITFVYVTHDQEEALTMSDRIAVMHRGKVEQLGTPEELYERPRTRFVADFIGTSNLLAGSVEVVDGSSARRSPRVRRVLPDVGRRRAWPRAVPSSCQHPAGVRRAPADRRRRGERQRSDGSGRTARSGAIAGRRSNRSPISEATSSTSSARRAACRSRRSRRRPGTASRSAAQWTFPGRPTTRSSSPSSTTDRRRSPA